MYEKQTLDNKVVFISGGTSGINLGIAKGMVEVGAKVAVLGRDADKANAAAAEIMQEKGGTAIALTADVRDPDQIEKALRATTEQLGKIDVLIAGAAGNFPAPALAINPKGFKTVIDIDLLGTYHVFHIGFNYIAKNASMIAITAPQAVVPMAYQAHVCAAKAGINMLIKCLALEWGPAGIRVNGISPGAINDTEGADRLAPEGPVREAMIKKVPSRRFGEKQEIADAAIYLSSTMGKYVNGTILTVDGGTELGDASTDCLSIPDR